MPASWLQDVMGPTPAPRVVRTINRPAPGTGGWTATPGGNVPNGSTAPAFDVNSILERLQGQFDSANNAGLEQYRNLMSGVRGTRDRTLGAGGLYDQAAGQMEGFGATANRRIEDNRLRSFASADQDLTNRGLGNTTIRNSVQRGIDSDAESARQEVGERVATARAGQLTQRAGAEMEQGRFRADSILSRRNVTPDADMYAQLIARLMESGGGGNFGSGGNGGGTVTPGTGGFGGTSINGAGGGSQYGQGASSVDTTGGGVQTFTPDGPGFDASPSQGSLERINGTRSGYRFSPQTGGNSAGLVYISGGRSLPNSGHGWTGPFNAQGQNARGSLFGNFWRPPPGYDPTQPNTPAPTGGR